MSVRISIIVCAKNEESYIENCIKSILSQSIQDFELIIVDDLSTDKTSALIDGFKDPRILHVKNQRWLGISKSRNVGIEKSRADFIFFTDADCIVTNRWLEEGLKFFKDKDCVAVEGAIIYVSESYKPGFSDFIMENRSGKKYMTGNIAFRRSVFEKIGAFQSKLSYYEDREMALRILADKMGVIGFNSKMIVCHPQVIQSWRTYMHSAHKNKNRIYLYKKFGDKECFMGRIFAPFSLLKVLFPPLAFSSLLQNRFRRVDDYKLLPFTYALALNERILFWRECVRERVFLI
jgi:glycosyltransferase involved in cell wall biosynthesis